MSSPDNIPLIVDSSVGIPTQIESEKEATGCCGCGLLSWIWSLLCALGARISKKPIPIALERITAAPAQKIDPFLDDRVQKMKMTQRQAEEINRKEIAAKKNYIKNGNTIYPEGSIRYMNLGAYADSRATFSQWDSDFEPHAKHITGA